jgi:hypothetical protein
VTSWRRCSPTVRFLAAARGGGVRSNVYLCVCVCLCLCLCVCLCVCLCDAVEHGMSVIGQLPVQAPADAALAKSMRCVCDVCTPAAAR